MRFFNSTFCLRSTKWSLSYIYIFDSVVCCRGSRLFQRSGPSFTSSVFLGLKLNEVKGPTEFLTSPRAVSLLKLGLKTSLFNVPFKWIRYIRFFKLLKCPNDNLQLHVCFYSFLIKNPFTPELFICVVISFFLEMFYGACFIPMLFLLFF